MPETSLRLLCLIVLLGTLGPSFAAAHPGHDHTTPIGIWPEHTVSDATAGIATAPGSSEAMGAASASNLFGVTQQAMIDSSETALSAWKLATGATGSGADAAVDNVVSQIVADVNTVAFNNNWVYLRTSGIPTYEIGPSNNQATPGDIDATYRVSRNPTPELGARTESVYQLGTIGVFVNGVSIFSPWDATSWIPETNQLSSPGGGGNQGAEWNVNALWRRASGMDAARGHSASRNGQTNPDGSTLGLYHHHMIPTSLLEELDPGNTGQQGSPVVGFAFDGYPIVGPYAYEEQPDGSLAAVPMTSSYTVQDQRGATGPTVADYELGSFMEDFVYVAGSGRLNEFNMAFVKFDPQGRAVLTDEADPDGDWAYFLTVDTDPASSNDITLDNDVAWPYVIGPEFFGEVDTMLVGQGQAQITVPGNVTFAFEQLTGDFNLDGVVDAADYTTWRDNFGQPAGTLFNDPTGEPIGAEQYLVWKTNFGATLAAATAAASTIPEPTSALLLATLLLGHRRRR